MNPIATLLLAATLTLPVTTLVLQSGERLAVEGEVREENDRVIFRSGGRLFSIRLDEVDAEATRIASQPDTAPKNDGPKKLKVTDEERKRLIAELEKNHGGTPAPEAQRTLPPPERPRSRAEVEREVDREWSWRERARNYEESVRQAKENLALLQSRAEQLRSEISGFISLGYKPRQFTYQTTQLQYTLEQIPYAELAVTRAERAYAQFRDDARKQGIMPGWLR